jgi:hypothetical protein
MLYESEPSIARHRGQSGHMVNGKSPISLKNFDLGWHYPMLSGPAGAAYSSLAREIVIAASVLVRVHSMSRRR